MSEVADQRLKFAFVLVRQIIAISRVVFEVLHFRRRG